MPAKKKAEALTKAPKNELTAYGVTDVVFNDAIAKKAEASKLAPLLTPKPCDTPERYQWFSEQKLNFRAIVKAMDATRTSITQPILKAKRDVDALFSAIKGFEAALDVIDSKLLAYDRKQLVAQQEALAQASAAASKGDALAAAAAIDSIPLIVEGVGHSVRPTLSWNLTSMSEVPLDYLVVNEDAVKAFIKEWEKSGSTEVPTIPGLKFSLDVKSRAKPV